MNSEPCVNCEHKYKCDEQRLACAQFRFFVNTSYISEVAHRVPTREIYMDIFHTEPKMVRREAA